MGGCLSSADRDPASSAADEPSASLDPAKGVAALESMGYAKDEIQQVEGGFIVQGDMGFRLKVWRPVDGFWHVFHTLYTAFAGFP